MTDVTSNKLHFMATLISTNPALDYQVVGEVEVSSDVTIETNVQAANAAKQIWKELGVEKRVALLGLVCEAFEKRQDEVAELITRETGKTLAESRGEVGGTISEWQWFLGNAGKALADEVTYEDEQSLHRIVYEPLGAVAVISPWNFPFSIAIWGIVPNLLSGNTVVFKISEECPLVGKLIEEIMHEQNLPEGVFAEVYGDGTVGKKLAESAVNLIWFTGSTQTGKQLYKTAAEKFIKVILEMGGSSPCVVFDDVNGEEFVQAIYPERFSNNGQVCDAIKRLIVHACIFDQVVEQLKLLVETKKVGNPLSRDTNLGSLVAKRQLDLLEEQVADAVQKGATVITGGKTPDGLEGAFYQPTLLTNVTSDMRVWKEEIFGPVLPMVAFQTEAEAIVLANDTPYGLGSRVFTSDRARALRVASAIEAGTVEINHVSRWKPCNPFGGYKQSGMGREHGLLGFRELCQVKLIAMEK
jgi:succinate-semialdehyde dehydrogenase/glutarate-semialdehyde dehydrogenase